MGKTKKATKCTTYSDKNGTKTTKTTKTTKITKVSKTKGKSSKSVIKRTKTTTSTTKDTGNKGNKASNGKGNKASNGRGNKVTGSKGSKKGKSSARAKGKEKRKPKNKDDATGFPHDSDIAVIHKKFKVEKVVFSRGKTWVCKAKHRANRKGPPVAVKYIEGPSLKNGEAPHEVSVMQAVGPHPHILPLLEWFVIEKGRYCIVTPYCEQDQVDEEHLVLYMEHYLGAIAHVHSRGIIYRDVKPSNFMYSLEDAHGILFDFDLSVKTNKKDPPRDRKGTIGYLAPEVDAGQPYGRKCDIYSLGVVFFELLFHYETGGWTTRDMIDQTLDDYARTVERGEPDTAFDLLCAMLNILPEDRPSAEDCLKFPYFAYLKDSQYSVSRSNYSSNSGASDTSAHTTTYDEPTSSRGGSEGSN